MSVYVRSISILIALTGFLSAAYAQQRIPSQTFPLDAPGGPSRPPFTSALSNTTPLAFGMSADEAAFALGGPLNYISGKPGEEIFMAVRNIGGAGFSFRNDPLYLQFRKGRLTGWKGDWARRWMWR